jgi:hypothetical protein
MKKKLEEFLELEKNTTPGPWTYEPEVINPGSYSEPPWGEPPAVIYPTRVKGCDGFSVCNSDNAQFIAQSRTIAPQAVNKLMEAVELLERAKEEIQNIYGRDNDLTMEIFKFLEDFNND